MRAILMVLGLAACGGEEDGLDPPDDCGPDELRYTFEFSDANGEDVGEGTLSLANVVFVNKLDDDPGVLDIGDVGGRNGTARVFLEFDRLLLDDSTVPVRGFVKLDADLDFGHCATAGFSGRLLELPTDDGWQFSLVGLHRAPYCDTPEMSGSFAACFRYSQ